MHAQPSLWTRYTSALLPAAVLLAALILSPAQAGQATAACQPCYVWQGVPGDVQDGTSWETAYTDLASAIARAAPGDTLWVAAGVYTPGSARSDAFTLKPGLALYGGFSGGETSLDQRNPRAGTAVLSGAIGADGPADDSYHVVALNLAGASSGGQTARLDGFVIRGGNADGAGDAQNGGGLWLKGAPPLLANLTFVENAAAGKGGGMYVGTPTEFAVERVTFLRNAAGEGGGLYLDSGSKLELRQSYFLGNRAAINGGGLTANNATLLGSNLIFSGNAAGQLGGGINQYTGKVHLMNATFAANAAQTGGAIAHRPEDPYLLTNGILWGNAAEVDPAIWNNGNSQMSILYSIVQGGASGQEVRDVDPLFVRAPVPGADGVWGTPDDDYGDLRLRSGSPGVDRGTGDSAPQIDIDDSPRPADGDGDGAAIIDLGAYEVVVSSNQVFLPVVTR